MASAAAGDEHMSQESEVIDTIMKESDKLTEGASSDQVKESPEEDSQTNSSSSFAQLRANLAKKSDSFKVSSIDDFYRRQKAEKAGQKNSKGEASARMHDFRESAASPQASSDQVEESSEKEDSQTNSSSSFAQLRANLARKSDSFKVSSIIDFNQRQKAEKAGAKNSKGEAAARMHDFRESAASPQASSDQVEESSEKEDSQTNSSSSFAQLRANLARKSDSSVKVSSIDDFNQRQKAEKAGAKNSKGEAAARMHDFRESAVSPQANTTARRESSIRKAANRAAAAVNDGTATRASVALFRDTTESSSSSGEASSPKVVVRSLAEFYQVQRELRQTEMVARKQASDMKYLGYVSLLTNSKMETKFEEKSEAKESREAAVDSEEADVIIQLLGKNHAQGELETCDDHGVAAVEQESEVKGGGEKQAHDTVPKAITSQVGVAEIENPVVLVDYKDSDYRGFIFVVHENHGLMLLHCTRKRKKGPHHQLPGGHIDEPEFLAAARMSPDAHAQLIIAAQMGAARELFEETGMDVRDKLFRLEPAALRNGVSTNKNGKFILPSELKKRLYFFLPVTDGDFISLGLTAPMTDEGSHLRLKLSIEHSGFVFEKDPEISANLLKSHSGGHGSKALLMAMEREEEDKIDIDTSFLSVDTSIDDEEEQEEVSPGDMFEVDEETPLIQLAEAQVLIPEDMLQADAVMPIIQLSDEIWSVSKGEETQALITPDQDAAFNLKELPIDLLPPPERKNFLTCCFCVLHQK